MNAVEGDIRERNLIKGREEKFREGGKALILGRKGKNVGETEGRKETRHGKREKERIEIDGGKVEGIDGRRRENEVGEE